MTTYNLVNAAHLVGGQAEDVSDVLANLQAIATVLNGNLDNNNLNAAAAIAPSKIAGYPSDGTKALFGDALWKVPGAGGGGGLTLITDIPPLGADGAIDITSIPATYSHLKLLLYLRSATGTAEEDLMVRLNNDAGASQYDSVMLIGPGNTPATTTSLNQTAIRATNGVVGSTGTAGYFSVVEITIINYTEASNPQPVLGLITSNQNPRVVFFGGLWKGTAAVNRITLVPGGTNFKAGSRATLYGMQ